MKRDDVIVTIDGKAVIDDTSLRNRVAELSPGSEVVFDYYREGKKASVKVVVGEQSGTNTPVITNFGFRVREEPVGDGPNAEKALVIDQVAMGSPAARSGLRPGLRVLGVGRSDVKTVAEFDKAASAYSVDQGLPLRIKVPSGQSVFVTVGGNEAGVGPR